MAIIFDERGLPITSSNPFPVGITGSNGEQDVRGLHADRPAATAVPAGSTYWSVDEPSAPGTVFVSDGATWTTVTVL